jgi:hypothetical protein
VDLDSIPHYADVKKISAILLSTNSNGIKSKLVSRAPVLVLHKERINSRNSNTNPVSCFMHLNKPLLEFLEIQRKIISMTLITAFSELRHKPPSE